VPRWPFEAGAGLYGRMTTQDAWRDSCQRLVERLPSTDRPLRIVDLGCGPGIVALELARCRPQDFVSGMDVASRMLARAATPGGGPGARQGAPDLDSGRHDPHAIHRWMSVYEADPGSRAGSTSHFDDAGA
jgi:SAM-dependent methyltransferase